MKKAKEKESEEKLLLLKRKRTKGKENEQNSLNTSKESHKREIIITKTSKRPNRKRLLKNKLEFFLSDINLYHDKYLKRIYLSHNESVSPEIFLTFNSIKILLSDIDKTENKKNVLIKAVEISNKLKYDRATNKIKRNAPYQEKLLDTELYDKCTIYIENFPPVITHTIIYDIFKDYKILYISLLKRKNNKLNGKAFITLKNVEDVQGIIDRYNNSVPKQISLLNPKELKPLKIMTKENYKNNILIENNNKMNVNNEEVINDKIKNNIDENACIRINNIKDGISLKDAKKCFGDKISPLFIDINRKEKKIIIRFGSKKESDNAMEIVKKNNCEIINDLINVDLNEKKLGVVEELNEEETKEYINFVKKEMEIFKEKKENKKKEKKNKVRIILYIYN